MSLKPFDTLRRRPLRRSVAVLAMFALLLAGFAQAAHFHKGHGSDTSRSTETHLQCLLCLHADRGAGPPELPRISAPALIGGILNVAATTSRTFDDYLACYDARGPPLV